jgi:hypothetical protein
VLSGYVTSADAQDRGGAQGHLAGMKGLLHRFEVDLGKGLTAGRGICRSSGGVVRIQWDRNTSVLGGYKGDKNGPPSPAWWREGMGVSKSANPQDYSRNGEVNPTFAQNSLGVHPKFIGV